jgi:hypothetical protein
MKMPLPPEVVFFAAHPDRKTHIRKPADPLEFLAEFRSLGPHDFDRRRIIYARVAPHVAARFNRELMAIPFLAFADETIEDRDDILLPILDEIMREARKDYQR